MSKISPRLREEAAVYCSAMACWYMDPVICEDPEPSAEVDAIVSQLMAIVESHPSDWTDETCATMYAEAEAMLRTGWEPRMD